MCQLCFKTSFPLKQLQGHFYHVTCLILFNLGISFMIQLKSKRELCFSDKVSLIKK